MFVKYINDNLSNIGNSTCQNILIMLILINCELYIPRYPSKIKQSMNTFKLINLEMFIDCISGFSLKHEAIWLGTSYIETIPYKSTLWSNYRSFISSRQIPEEEDEQSQKKSFTGHFT